jgi:hypothetical protein
MSLDIEVPDIDKSDIEKLLDDQLQGLMIPAESSEYGLVTWAVFVAVIALVLLFLWRYQQYRKTPVIMAKRKLKALHGGQQKDTQARAIEMAKILCQGLGVARLDEYEPVTEPESTDMDWNVFRVRLDSLCYTTSGQREDELNQLFSEACFWLGRAGQ